MVPLDLLDQAFGDVHVPVFIQGAGAEVRRGKDLHLDGILAPEPLREIANRVCAGVWTELEKIDAALAVEFAWADHLPPGSRQFRQAGLSHRLTYSPCARESNEQAAGQEAKLYLAAVDQHIWTRLPDIQGVEECF